VHAQAETRAVLRRAVCRVFSAASLPQVSLHTELAIVSTTPTLLVSTTSDQVPQRNNATATAQAVPCIQAA
jgi:hypothetical protein